LALELAPGIVITDISMDGDVMTFIRRLKESNSKVRVLVWSMHDERLYAESTFRAGADGYISKLDVGAHLLDALRCMQTGNQYRAARK
jgi:DNA-binding NarL/FixJ family response regulator